MSNNDFSNEIISLRKQYLIQIDEDNNKLSDLHDELLRWQQKIINNLNKFIQEKFNEIKQKRLEIHRQQIRHLDILHTNNINHDNSHLFEDFNNLYSPIKIFYPKQIDFNQYLQLNINEINRSLVLINNTHHFNLSSYQRLSTISIQTNLTSLFTTHDRLLIYYDHFTSSAALHIFDLQNYLEQTNHNRSCLKSRILCREFQGKIMHIEYSSYLQAFLLATGSKLFILEILNTGTNYRVTEYFDIAHGNFPGVLQKFVCHPTSPHVIHILIKTFFPHTLVQIDLSKNFNILNKWDYPQTDLSPTTDNNTTKNNLHLKFINDFVVGKDIAIFAVTYELNDNTSSHSYQIHVRSIDMNLQHRLILNSTFSPLRICRIPCDYSSISWNQQEQFLIIFEESKVLTLYDVNPTKDNDHIQLIDEITLDTEPKNIGFVNNDLSILLLRNLFHIAIYKQTNNTNHQRRSFLCRTDNVP